MINIYIDGKKVCNKDSFYRIMEDELKILINGAIGEEESLGRSLDAVYDVLADSREEICLHISNAGDMFSEERTYYDRFMKMLRAVEGENKMIKHELCEHGIMSTKERGYGKINLSLDVTGKLDNGYHLVKMVMASVSLYDELTFTRSDMPGIRLKWADSEKNLSLGEDNLIIKAARAILSEKYLKDTDMDIENIGLDITLSKNIPMAAGMAGGSADAAATLRALNRLYDLKLSDDELCKIGVKLGADVPFCVLQGCYLSEGIGEILTKLPDLGNALKSKAYIAFIKPPIDVSTKFVYEHLDTEGVSVHPDVDGQIDAINAGDLYKMTGLMRNVLRDVTVPAYPIVLELEKFLMEHGAIGSMMTGSGPTVFGIFDDEDKCMMAVKSAGEKYPEMFSEKGYFM